MAINFNKDSVFNLTPLNVSDVNKVVPRMMTNGENIVAVFKTIRDQLVFTTKRIISIDVQGITGKKTSFSSIPYKTIQYYSFQTPAFIELVPDTELELYFANGITVKFEFKGRFDIAELDKIISSQVLC